jgi:hypothetical protein
LSRSFCAGLVDGFGQVGNRGVLEDEHQRELDGGLLAQAYKAG